MAAGAEHRVQCTRKTFGLDSMCCTCLVHTVHSQAGNQSVYETNCSMKHLCLPVIHKHLHNSAASSTGLAWLAPFRLFCWPSGYLNLSESHFVFPRSPSRYYRCFRPWASRLKCFAWEASTGLRSWL
jgi:hypothetical protein